jgi:hypothetical protein
MSAGAEYLSKALRLFNEVGIEVDITQLRADQSLYAGVSQSGG